MWFLSDTIYPPTHHLHARISVYCRKAAVGSTGSSSIITPNMGSCFGAGNQVSVHYHVCVTSMRKRSHANTHTHAGGSLSTARTRTDWQFCICFCCFWCTPACGTSLSLMSVYFSSATIDFGYMRAFNSFCTSFLVCPSHQLRSHAANASGNVCAPASQPTLGPRRLRMIYACVCICAVLLHSRHVSVRVRNVVE